MRVLVVVDMQNDFIYGPLGTKEARDIVPKVYKKVQSYLLNRDMVIFTRDTHTEDYLNTQEGRNLPVVHCVRGTEGWKIGGGVYVDGCPIIDKEGFGSLELAERIAEMVYAESVELVGLCTDICVISNAMVIKARLPEMPISVGSSCCAGVTPQSHENALKAMEMCQIKIL